MPNLLLLRHGESQWNLENRFTVCVSHVGIEASTLVQVDIEAVLLRIPRNEFLCHDSIIPFSTQECSCQKYLVFHPGNWTS